MSSFLRVGRNLISVHLAASLGLEPRQRDPESLVLPLHHEANAGRNLRLHCAHSQARQVNEFVWRAQFLAQSQLGPFASAIDFKITLAFRSNLSRGLHHCIDCCIVMIRIVMKKEELAHVGIKRERNSRG